MSTLIRKIGLQCKPYMFEPTKLVNFNSYQAKVTDGEDTEKEEEIFIDLEDQPEDVKHEKMQNNNNNNNFVETEREE